VDQIKKLRLLTITVLLLAPIMGAAMFLVEPARADIIGCSTGTTVIAGFPVESIAAGLLLGLLLVLLVTHQGFHWIKTRIGNRLL
jgi:hypothetical protein